MRTKSTRIEAILAVLILSVATVLVGVAGEAHATTKGSANGFAASNCYADWRASAVFDRDLTNEDVVDYDGRQFTELMTGLDGSPINSWVNGGFLYEVNKFLDPAATGWVELQHFVNPRADKADGTTETMWRFPVGTDTAIRNGTVTLTLPEYAQVLTVDSVEGFFIRVGDAHRASGEESNWSQYTWKAAPTAMLSGNTVTLYNVNLAPGEGIGVQVKASMPTEKTYESTNIGEVSVKGRLDNGTANCPAVESGVNPAEPCFFDWEGDATYLVSGDRTSIGDITRQRGVAHENGEPGKLGVDGWARPGPANQADGLASFNGRFVYSTDHPVENGTIQLIVDPALTTDETKFTEHTPVGERLSWRVDDLYPNGIEITDRQWDPATNTMTYTYNAPAMAAMIVTWSGTLPQAEYAADATFTNRTTAKGAWAVDAANPKCPPTPGLELSKLVEDSEAPKGVVTEGEELTYRFVLTNTGNVPLSDLKIVDARLGTEPIDCVPALAVGQTLVCTAPYTVTADDIAAGGVVNTATAIGVAPVVPDKAIVSNQDDATIPAKEVVTETSTVTTTTAVDCDCTVVTETSEVPVTVTVTDTSATPTTLTETVTTEVETTVTETESSATTETVTRTIDVGAETGERGSLETGSLGGIGSLDDLGTGSGAGSVVPTDSESTTDGSIDELAAGSAGSSGTGSLSGGSSAGSLALGSLGLGVLSIGGLIWAIQNNLIVLPAGMVLPVLPGIDWNSLMPAPLPAQPVEPAPQAPGPDVDNGRG